MLTVDNLINSPTQRLARQTQKQTEVLRFLRQHLWSTQQILQLVMQLKSRQACHKSLVQMEQKGYLHRHIYNALGGNLTIWGITHQGQAMAFDLSDEIPITATFEPSRISEQTIRHQLDVQNLRLKAEAAGWHDWIDGDRLGIQGKNQKRPDGIAKDSSGNLIAFECERTFKSTKRYQDILVNYLKLIRSEKISGVVWVCPTDEMASRLRVIITSIDSLRVNGQKVSVMPEKHHINLHFCSYDQWPNFRHRNEMKPIRKSPD